MGADIHMYAEVRKPGGWEKVGREFRNPYYRPNEKTTVASDGYVWNAEKIEHPYDGRNYVVFAFLADVRNGTGFAGIPYGNRIEPLAAPRGLPDDVSAEVLADSDYWDADGHSHSWFTLRELQGANYDVGRVNIGVVEAKHWEATLEQGEPPHEWCGSTVGPGIVTVPEDYYRSARAAGTLDPEKRYFVQTSWPSKLADDLESFRDSMKQLEPLGAPDDVRVVFWFDN